MTTPMRVVRWTSYAEAESLPDNHIGGIGGWFGVDTTSPYTVRLLMSVLGIKARHTWKDYADQFNERGLKYVDALRAEILARGLRRGGDWHQNSGEGCPVFEDGTSSTWSYRAWGDLMAAIWTERDGKQYTYMDFYMDGDGEAQRGKAA